MPLEPRLQVFQLYEVWGFCVGFKVEGVWVVGFEDWVCWVCFMSLNSVCSAREERVLNPDSA